MPEEQLALQQGVSNRAVSTAVKSVVKVYQEHPLVKQHPSTGAGKRVTLVENSYIL
jgi:hypothetical protein